MNELIPKRAWKSVQKAEDLSDTRIQRLRLTFTNGYGLSVVRGTGTYGEEGGLFEIAPVDTDGSLNGDLLDEKDQGDDVLGWCDVETVQYYATKLSEL